METTAPKRKARITDLNRHDLSLIIASNLEKLETDYVVFDRALRKVLVKDGSAADLKFKAAEAGSIIPLGTVTFEAKLYRSYAVDPKLLTD